MCIVKWILIEFEMKIIEAFCLNDIDKLLVYACAGARALVRKLTRMRCLTENQLLAEPHNIYRNIQMCVDVNKVLSYSIKAALRQSTCTVLIRVNGFECARPVGTKQREKEQRYEARQRLRRRRQLQRRRRSTGYILYRKKMWPVHTEQMRYD